MTRLYCFFASLAFVLTPIAASQQPQVPIRELSTGSTTLKEIPVLGYGTWNLPSTSNATAAVSLAIQSGFRHIDAAAIYGNEREVGEGIKDGLAKTGLKREDIWVTSKLWNDAHDPEKVPKALYKTLRDLGLDYLDLYLMHWPVKSGDGGQATIEYLDTYRAMLTLPRARAAHIGISNFSPVHVKTLLAHFTHPDDWPYAHQFETHPYLTDSDFIEWHAEYNIRVTAYSPLGNTNPTYTAWREEPEAARVPALLEHPVVLHIAARSGCTPAQVVLAWGLQRGTSVITKSARADRIKENFAALECKLRQNDYVGLANVEVKRFNNPGAAWGVSLYEGLQDGPGVSMGSVIALMGLRMRFALDRWLKWYNEVWWDSEGAQPKTEI